jgi:Uri superfamily endonuclease
VSREAHGRSQQLGNARVLRHRFRFDGFGKKKSWYMDYVESTEGPPIVYLYGKAYYVGIHRHGTVML